MAIDVCTLRDMWSQAAPVAVSPEQRALLESCVLPASVHETGNRPAYGHEQEDGSWHDRGRLRRQDV